jgi:cytoskeletal protein CcmA (bactofilin family)
LQSKVRVRWPLYNLPFIKTDFLLSKDTVLHGPLQSACGGCIDGLVKGYVAVNGNVIIGKKAEIIGDVTAKAAKVFGKVYGNITCNDLVILYNSAFVKGDIKAKII